jgi:hypothetical protein
MSRLRVGRAALPWSGGAYFRFIPYRLYRGGVAARLRRRSWFMFYLHSWELDPDEVPPPNLSYPRRLRSYAGRDRMRGDLRRLLTEFGSLRIDETLRSLGFASPAD